MCFVLRKDFFVVYLQQQNVLDMDKTDTGVIFVPWIIEDAVPLITQPLNEELKNKTVSAEYYGEIVCGSENYIG